MSQDTRLADRIEITDLFTRLALLLDEKRWDDAGTVFAEDVALDSPRAGAIRGLDATIGFLREAEVPDELTQHVTTDLLVDLDGDEAAVAANSLVYFFRDGRAPHQASGLRVISTVVRTPAGWRISEQRVTPSWIRRD